MSELHEIRDRIRNISGIKELGAPFFTAEVTEVSDNDCSVIYGTTTLTKVKLFSIGEAGKLLIKPKVGSKVTVADLSQGKLRDLIIIKADEVELIKYDQDGLVVEIDSVAKKINIKNDSTSLTKLMTSVYDIISKLTVSTPNGPSGTPLPPTVTALEKFKTDFQNLLK
ncbi:MAG: hypothetical protein NTW16_05790 [Bacteroidetes bacterium]|nr:hypothetical protein [Bacteroidota bacterium]